MRLSKYFSKIVSAIRDFSFLKNCISNKGIYIFQKNPITS